MQILKEIDRMLVYDGMILMSTGASATSRTWQRYDTTWGQLVELLRIPRVTHERVTDYHAATAKERTRYKDVGGYIGGVLQGTTRGKNDVVYRSLLTLDLDNVTDINAVWDLFLLTYDCAGVLHTTHSHLPAKPKARIIVPLAQQVTPKNYRLVSEAVADSLGLGQFDPTTHEPNRLMFWPSVCKDGQLDYRFEFNDAPWLNVTPLIKQQKEQNLIASSVKEDPKKVPGVVGAFCSKYDIHEAIAAFLSDIYVAVDSQRYKLVESDSTGGLVLYEGGQYCYSHHAKDPAQGKLLNSFQLVCKHKFNGDTDAMQKWIAENAVCPAGVELTLDNRGKPESTVSNMRRILNSDSEVTNTFYLDEFANKLMIYGDFPWMGLLDRVTFTWTDNDDAGLREWFETKYGMSDRLKLVDAVSLTANAHKIHPVRDFLKSCVWDHTCRAETLLIDFLGAEDTPYVRAVTRKALIGAVARIMQPGCKHDHVLVLVGPQGCRKSTTISKLGHKWYSDSLYTMQGKDAYELLQGYWVIELSEMAATKKADIEMMKQFISKQSDNFRAAYDRRTIDHPRQCAFFGSTNDEEFLRDYTGNRRFWPVNVQKVDEQTYARFDEDYIKQVWGEMVAAFNAGEKWYLEAAVEVEARVEQEKHLFENSIAGTVREFISRNVPKKWASRPLVERLSFYTNGLENATEVRDRVCALEIWLECFGGRMSDFTNAKAIEINNIVRRTPGWKPKTLRFNSDYGVQRGFVKVDGD